jgi:hypothetical protein
LTDLKSLGQALYNINLAMELFEEANLAYEKIEALLVKIYLKKNELDKLSVLTQFKGKRILDD